MKKILWILALLLSVTALAEAQNTTNADGVQRLEIGSGWQFRQSGAEKWMPAVVPGCVHTDLYSNNKIGDPFYRTNERDQQWIDKVGWEYCTAFSVTSDILDRANQRLIFEGLDTYAEVMLNGKTILTANNMFRRWAVDVKGILAEKNELVIRFRSPVDEDLPKIDDMGFQLPAINDQSENGGLGDRKISIFARKAPYHYGWDWGPRFVTMGIWRPVVIEGWDKARIESVHFRQTSVTSKLAKLTVVAEIVSDANQQAEVIIRDEVSGKEYVTKSAQLKKGTASHSFQFEIIRPNLWWSNGLGEPYLYNFSTQVKINGQLADSQEMEIGIRRLKVVREKDKKGQSFYFELNGVPVFAKGANYIPNDNFLPRVTPAKYEHIIRSAAEANMNMLRVWGGGIYENDIFYQLCDRYGILVWQDLMFACSMYPGDEEFLQNIRQEVTDNVKRLRNHACIALWCGNNEIDAAWSHDTPGGWGWKEKFDETTRAKIWKDYEIVFHELLPGILRETDPDRFYWPSSPVADFGVRASYSNTSGDMHYWGVWHGKEPFANFKKTKARFMSEYGFQSFPELSTVKTYTRPEDWDIISEVMSAHQRSGIGNERIRMYMEWDYHLPFTFEDMLYMSHVLQAEGIKAAIEAHRLDKPYCMGTLYWQLNDCWPVASWSSMDYYGRWKALQYFAKKAYAPVIVIPALDGNEVSVTIVSDRMENFTGNLDLNVIDFSGKVLWKNSQDVSVKANGNKSVFTADLSELIDPGRISGAVLSCKLKEDNRLISQNLLYFKPPKELELPKVSVDMKVTGVAEGYQITVLAPVLARNVYLTCEEKDGLFSDNYFDLLPGEAQTILFKTPNPGEEQNIKFKVRTLRDTYK